MCFVDGFAPLFVAIENCNLVPVPGEHGANSCACMPTGNWIASCCAATTHAPHIEVFNKRRCFGACGGE